VSADPQDHPLTELLRPLESGAEESFETATLTVAPADWTAALERLKDAGGFTYFDWLSAVDDGDEGFAVYCHLYNVEDRQHVFLSTRVPRESPSLSTATGVFRGAAWHERETAEMFGVDFVGHPYPERLLLSESFEGYPLRKDFVLTARVSKTWPGAKEPGESGDGSPSRRKMRPPGVPDPSWGPHEADASDG
jgi:NADH-quinone oxidoreductase subunit C